jgi:hypothetical protein
MAFTEVLVIEWIEFLYGFDERVQKSEYEKLLINW